MITAETNINTLNSLIRGELAAAETYEQALSKAAEEPGYSEVSRIGREHREATSLLQRHVRQFGGEPAAESGAWGTWSQTVMGAAEVFGNLTALKALKEGEEDGIREYAEALHDDDIHPACKDLIQLTLLPRLREHIRTLEFLMGGR
jgi:uncharacterized protein (TIGR02284 family)